MVLSSYYGKLFITKADNKNKDIGYWLAKQLALMTAGETPLVTNLISRSAITFDLILPTDYTYFSRYSRGFTYNGFKFEFHYAARIALGDIDVASIEKDKYTLVASNGKGTYLLLDMNNVLYSYENKVYTPIGDMFSYLNLDTTDMPNEFITIKIFSKKLPLVLLLAYYKGLIPLLKMFKTEYKIVKRTEKYDAKEYLAYTFRDYRLLISKKNKRDRILFSGLDLVIKQIRDIRLASLNRADTFALLFSNMELIKVYINEFTMLKGMFIDPITEIILKYLKEPTTFFGLLIRSIELLMDDNYKNPVLDTELLIKSSERMVGFMYTELVKSARTFKNKEEFARANMTIDPYSVWRQIGDDSTSVIVKYLNPVDFLKQTEELTKIGAGGMNRDAITKEARSYHPSAIGIVSEATKDSSSVGISTYLSAAPRMDNVLGIKTSEAEDNGIAGKLSTSALLAPFVETEAPKRAGFISIQNGHVAPIEGAELPYIRTMEELAIAYRVNKQFAFMAAQDGVVTKLTKDSLEVTYIDGSKDDCKLGSWSTRAESNKAFRHNMITDLKINAIFSKADPLAWNQAFFEKDFLFRGKLIYKMATFANVALSEEEATKEDSSIIASTMYNKISTDIYTTRSFIFEGTNRIVDVPNANEKVKPDTLLYTVINPMANDLNLSKDLMASLQEVKNSYAYAEKSGILEYAEIYYNCPKSDLSDSFQELIERKDLVRVAKQVNNQYSVNGKPLLKGQIQIVFYIAGKQGAGVGEKIVVANQLKSIIGDIITYKMYTLEDKRIIDAFFSKLSIENRIVNSAYIMGTTNILLDALQDRIVDIWNS